LTANADGNFDRDVVADRAGALSAFTERLWQAVGCAHRPGGLLVTVYRP
jgi:hypothetical protein